MKLTSKYKNAHTRDGRWTALRNSRRFIAAASRWVDQASQPDVFMVSSTRDRRGGEGVGRNGLTGQARVRLGSLTDGAGRHLLDRHRAELQLRLFRDRVRRRD